MESDYDGSGGHKMIVDLEDDLKTDSGLQDTSAWKIKLLSFESKDTWQAADKSLTFTGKNKHSGGPLEVHSKELEQQRLKVQFQILRAEESGGKASTK